MYNRGTIFQVNKYPKGLADKKFWAGSRQAQTGKHNSGPPTAVHSPSYYQIYDIGSTLLIDRFSEADNFEQQGRKNNTFLVGPSPTSPPQ
ncbi:hypothetical protein COCOBI_02-3520 [Coccomyxa sp. Obi]|nr:hypothetical protein COCOBI_02-3520 [Coccomyxa sp. Obi]